jgi:hypothetical protein
MLFGRAFEKALAAFFLRQDASEVLSNEWARYRDLDLQYFTHDNWGRGSARHYHQSFLAGLSLATLCSPRFRDSVFQAAGWLL